MRSILDEYTETGLLGAYHPKAVIKREVDNNVFPLYRDTHYTKTGTGMELEREMIVGGRTFCVHSFFSSASATPTQKMLRIIDSDLEKK